jgi:hypothetical protein
LSRGGKVNDGTVVSVLNDVRDGFKASVGRRTESEGSCNGLLLEADTFSHTIASTSHSLPFWHIIRDSWRRHGSLTSSSNRQSLRMARSLSAAGWVVDEVMESSWSYIAWCEGERDMSRRRLFRRDGPRQGDSRRRCVGGYARMNLDFSHHQTQDRSKLAPDVIKESTVIDQRIQGYSPLSYLLLPRTNLSHASLNARHPSHHPRRIVPLRRVGCRPFLLRFVHSLHSLED